MGLLKVIKVGHERVGSVFLLLRILLFVVIAGPRKASSPSLKTIHTKTQSTSPPVSLEVYNLSSSDLKLQLHPLSMDLISPIHLPLAL